MRSAAGNVGSKFQTGMWPTLERMPMKCQCSESETSVFSEMCSDSEMCCGGVFFVPFLVNTTLSHCMDCLRLGLCVLPFLRPFCLCLAQSPRLSCFVYLLVHIQLCTLYTKSQGTSLDVTTKSVTMTLYRSQDFVLQNVQNNGKRFVSFIHNNGEA